MTFNHFIYRLCLISCQSFTLTRLWNGLYMYQATQKCDHLKILWSAHLCKHTLTQHSKRLFIMSQRVAMLQGCKKNVNGLSEPLSCQLELRRRMDQLIERKKKSPTVLMNNQFEDTTLCSEKCSWVFLTTFWDNIMNETDESVLQSKNCWLLF